jgi:hypothetical protein
VVSIFQGNGTISEWIITMLDERSIRLRTHRDNIARYRAILKTDLTDLERQFIERRLSEEQSEFELLQTASRVKAKVQNGPAHLTAPDTRLAVDRLAGNESTTGPGS